MLTQRRLSLLLALGGLVALTPSTARASGLLIPAFARKYNLSCSVCHAPVPRLTPAGEAFAANGFEFEPGEEPRDTIATGDALLRLQRALPLAVRFDAYSTFLSKRDNAAGVDLKSPWVIKLLSGGQVANKVSYYTYFLLTEGGEVAGLEDAYLQFTDVLGSGVSLQVGQFQVSDPLFRRELRLTYEDYQPYKVRVGHVMADLTYDRGLTALWSPWEGSNVSLSMVAGRGLAASNELGQYDRDTDKNFALRLSQEFGHVRVGMFGYAGREKQDDIQSTIRTWGPDVTVNFSDRVQVNAQYLQRTDDDPWFGGCTVLHPCADGRTAPFETTVKSGFVEAVISPRGAAGRFFVTGIYNRVDANAAVVDLGLPEQTPEPALLKRYQSASLGAHWLYRRNVRFMSEGLWDFERERARLVTGLVVGF